jgi:hypothetical protein
MCEITNAEVREKFDLNIKLFILFITVLTTGQTVVYLLMGILFLAQIISFHNPAFSGFQTIFCRVEV